MGQLLFHSDGISTPVRCDERVCYTGKNGIIKGRFDIEKRDWLLSNRRNG